jgi:hypothetical protein
VFLVGSKNHIGKRTYGIFGSTARHDLASRGCIMFGHRTEVCLQGPCIVGETEGSPIFHFLTWNSMHQQSVPAS